MPAREVMPGTLKRSPKKAQEIWGKVHDAASEAEVAQQGFRAAVTTRAAVADLATDSALALPRLDTIDLPHARDAAPNDWTLAA